MMIDREKRGGGTKQTRGNRLLLEAFTFVTLGVTTNLVAENDAGYELWEFWCDCVVQRFLIDTAIV